MRKCDGKGQIAAVGLYITKGRTNELYGYWSKHLIGALNCNLQPEIASIIKPSMLHLFWKLTSTITPLYLFICFKCLASIVVQNL